MEFSMVGGVMLLVVLIIYMKMIDSRAASRQRKSQIRHWLEKTEVFESVADDRNALKTIEEARLALPENEILIEKEKAIRLRLTRKTQQ